MFELRKGKRFGSDNERGEARSEVKDNGNEEGEMIRGIERRGERGNPGTGLNEGEERNSERKP